ncbi:MAG TPA: threonine synthase, partial [Bacillota bacterium]|nr:threonine synthase [Bacillota bacterium]
LREGSYQERAALVLEPFLSDFSREEIDDCLRQAYRRDRFDHPAIAPLRRVSPDLWFLELWHGPTAAFKDMALQLLPHLLSRAARKCGEDLEIVILTATSGDTGKAALEGFKDVPGTRIIVFYPAKGVSEIQKRQMITQEGDNVHVIAVQGNFDDAQSGVKAIFNDGTLKITLAGLGYTLSSANSINWGRLAPQIVYYHSAYQELRAQGALEEGEKLNFVVPTGNFGNILAGYYAYRQGLPLGRLICASNRNHVLTDFFKTGVYDRRRPFYRTSSPSMDILISSNLERLLFELSGRQPKKVQRWMEQLAREGRYRIDLKTAAAIRKLFWGGFADEEKTAAAIRDTYRDYGYLVDPHTAVGKAVLDQYREATGDCRKAVILSTASPFKFNGSVCRALFGADAVRGKSEFELLEFLSRETGLPIPEGLNQLDKKPVRHRLTAADGEMMKKMLLMLLSFRP